MNSETIISSTGAKLNVYSLLPQKEVKAIIHIAHGMVEHANRYSRFAMNYVSLVMQFIVMT